MRRIRAMVLLAACGLMPVGAAAASHALVKAQTLTLRETPSTGAKALATLVTNQPVQVLERRGSEWAQVATLDGRKGWVLSRYLTPNGFVFAKLDKINVRRGPGEEFDVILTYGRNMPLRVLEIAPNGWLMVMDYEGDRGWVHPNVVQWEPRYVITLMPQCNVRGGPGTEHPLQFTAQKGVLLQVLEERQGWLRVRHADGDAGWISARIVFGHLDDVGPGAAMFPDEKRAAAGGA